MSYKSYISIKLLINGISTAAFVNNFFTVLIFLFKTIIINIDFALQGTPHLVKIITSYPTQSVSKDLFVHKIGRGNFR